MIGARSRWGEDGVRDTQRRDTRNFFFLHVLYDDDTGYLYRLTTFACTTDGKMTTSHGIDNDTAHAMRSCSRINLWLFNRLYCKQILTGGFAKQLLTL